MTQSRFAALSLLAALALAPELKADRLITKDGRILPCKKARPEGAGYRISFDSGEILVPDKSFVQSVEVEGDMADYVPQNEDEKQKLADGYVKYQGKWLSKAAYEAELKKNFDRSKARTEELAKHSEFSSAWEKESAHFNVKTNTSPELLDFYSELFETYYALQDQRIGINPTPSMRRKKMQVNVYKSYPEFRKLAPYGDREVPMGVLGFFSRGDQSLNFYHDYQDPGRSTWVALHECTHLLTFLIDQQYLPQIWLNEGVADYFGSSKVERDKKGKITITPGELQVDRILTVQQAIKDGASGTGGGQPAKGSGNRGKSSYGGRPDTKLEQMFFLSHDEFDGFQYAHSWSFVYFLNNFEKGKYQKAFDKFFKGLYTLEKGIPFESIAAGGMTGNGKQVKAEDIRAYLLKKLGLKDTEQMEKDWKKFISEIPISGPEARLKRGLQSVARMEFEPALEDLNAAIEGGTKDPRAWWARGQALAFEKKTEDGIKDLAKAVELDPLNANYRYVYSHLLAGMPIFSTGDIEDINIEFGSDKRLDKPEAKIEAGLASDLDPDNAEFEKWRARFN